VNRDWDAVARTIDERLTSLDMTQTELAVRAGVAPETVRELRNNLRPRRRSPRTLSAISEALGWDAGYLARVLDGRGGGSATSGQGTSIDLDKLQQEFIKLSERVDDIERRLNAMSS